MAALGLADLAARTAPMAEKKRNWVKKATANAHGQFRRKAQAAGKTTRAFAAAHDGDPGKLGKQSRLAETLMGMNKKRKSPLYNR